MPEENNRIYPISIKNSSIEIDSVSISFPPGYTLESTPDNIHITNKFGTYTMSIHVKDSTIELTRSLTIVADEYPPSDYSSLSTFYQKIFKSDRNGIVLIKKGG